MGRKAFKPEQIINKLSEAEVLLSQGSTVGEASIKLGVADQTYYHWRKEYGGMQVDLSPRCQLPAKMNVLVCEGFNFPVVAFVVGFRRPCYRIDVERYWQFHGNGW